MNVKYTQCIRIKMYVGCIHSGIYVLHSLKYTIRTTNATHENIFFSLLFICLSCKGKMEIITQKFTEKNSHSHSHAPFPYIRTISHRHNQINLHALASIWLMMLHVLYGTAQCSYMSFCDTFRIATGGEENNFPKNAIMTLCRQ